MATSPSIHRRISDRPLYLLAAIVIPLIVLAGFARTYYLKGLFGTPPLPNLIVQLHGIIMTVWVALFIVQVSLVATRRTRTHQRLGVLGAVLAALVVVVGVLTGLFAAARAEDRIPALQFVIVPLGDMLVFAVLIGAALYFRRRLDVHKRLMLVAAVNLLAPAIARIPLALITNGGPLAFFGLTDLCLLGFVAFDTIRHRRLHPAFLWSTLFVIAMQPLRIALAPTAAWIKFADYVVGLVR